MKVIDQALAHAAAEYPRESCGVVIVRRGRESYRACRNIAEDPSEQFTIAPDDYAEAGEEGEIVAIVHSHVDLPPTPSQADRVHCEASGLPWIIVNGKTGAVHRFEPDGYAAPLVGREFFHGVLDCYSLVRDYYRIEHGLLLTDYPRAWEWWNKGQDLYREHFAREGFSTVAPESLREGDALLIQVQSDVPNHAAIYLQPNMILHHATGRLSSRDVYGGYWRKHTVAVLRHARLQGGVA